MEGGKEERRRDKVKEEKGGEIKIPVSKALLLQLHHASRNVAGEFHEVARG